MSAKPIAKPREIPYRFGEAWNNYEASAIADLFSDNPDFVNVTGKWWDHKREIMKAHDYGFRVIFPDSHLEVLKVKVKMLDDDAAVVHSRIRVTGQTEQEVKEAGRRETMFIFVATKSDGQWLVESAQNTDIVFGKQTNIRDEDGQLKSVKYKDEDETITYDLNEHPSEAGEQKYR